MVVYEMNQLHCLKMEPMEIREFEQNVHAQKIDWRRDEEPWDINDTNLPRNVRPMQFREWPDDYAKYVYISDCKDASKHHSGWAMRNTNNHNTSILKKSCLGVLVCSLNCSLPDGSKVYERPAICDKARTKQKGSKCPNSACFGNIVQRECKGHNGYPVTHFWREDQGKIYFQCKGTHDHVRPPPKSTAASRRQRYGLKNSMTPYSRSKSRKPQIKANVCVNQAEGTSFSHRNSVMSKEFYQLPSSQTYETGFAHWSAMNQAQMCPWPQEHPTYPSCMYGPSVSPNYPSGDMPHCEDLAPQPVSQTGDVLFNQWQTACTQVYSQVPSAYALPNQQYYYGQQVTSSNSSIHDLVQLSSASNNVLNDYEYS